jgi:hypothetical protein
MNNRHSNKHDKFLPTPTRVGVPEFITSLALTCSTKSFAPRHMMVLTSVEVMGASRIEPLPSVEAPPAACTSKRVPSRWFRIFKLY